MGSGGTRAERATLAAHAASGATRSGPFQSAACPVAHMNMRHGMST